MSASPKASNNYSNTTTSSNGTNCCYQPYANNNGSTTTYLHHGQGLVTTTHSPSTSLSVVYGTNPTQQHLTSPSSFNVLQTRYQNEQINEKTSNSLTNVNGQGQTMANSNATALAASSAYRRNFNACAKPPYR